MRRLAERLAQAADACRERDTAELWRRLNDLDPVRPMVWINEVPWNEFSDMDDMKLVCRDPALRDIEFVMRKTLFQWDHFRVDMIVENWLASPKIWHTTGFGFTTREDTLAQHAKGGVVSHRYHPQITGPEDLEKFTTPSVTYDREATESIRTTLEDMVGDILPVRLAGVRHIWFTSWDVLYTLIDPAEFMYDMIDRPAFIEEMVRRYVAAQLAQLDQMEALGLLSPGNANVRVGSGGYGYTRELPPGLSPTPCAPREMWGCSNAQIFAEISPEMHWELALKHEIPWLDRWGMNYYGCCEQLHEKIDLLKRIPRLRKVSLSPRCDIEKARGRGADAYVLSVKPNPAIMVSNPWSPELARRQIRGLLEHLHGASAELILKDLSTLRGDLTRLEDWARIAMEEVCDFPSTA